MTKTKTFIKTFKTIRWFNRKKYKRQIGPIFYEICYELGDPLSRKRQERFEYFKYHNSISSLFRHGTVEFRIFGPGPKIRVLESVPFEEEMEDYIKNKCPIFFMIEGGGCGEWIEWYPPVLFDNMCDILDELKIEEFKRDKIPRYCEIMKPFRGKKGYEKIKKKMRFHQLDFSLDELIKFYENIKV